MIFEDKNQIPVLELKLTTLLRIVSIFIIGTLRDLVVLIRVLFAMIT